MFFIASQLLRLFTTPSSFALLLCFAGLLLLRTRYVPLGRKMLAAGVMLLAIAAFLPVGMAFTIPLESRFPQWRETAGAPVGIVVLGGAINPDVSFARGQVAIGAAAERITAAVELARRYPDARVVFTGGLPTLFNAPYREADFAGQVLTGLGVAPARLVLERQSRDTTENALFTRRLVKPRPGERWLLITSATHMPRAMGVFAKMGFVVEAYPVDYQTIGWKDLLKFPSPLRNLRLTDQSVHEWIGLLAYWLTGRTASLFPGPAN